MLEILSIAIAVLVVLVIAHFAVFYVLRTLYPPAPPAPAPVPVEVKTIHVSPQSFTEQNVILPTYETPIPMQTPSEERTPTATADVQGNPVQRDTGVDAPNPQ